MAKIVFFYRNEWEEHLKLNYGNECKGNNRYEGDNKETCTDWKMNDLVNIRKSKQACNFVYILCGEPMSVLLSFSLKSMV